MELVSFQSHGFPIPMAAAFLYRLRHNKIRRRESEKWTRVNVILVTEIFCASAEMEALEALEHNGKNIGFRLRINWVHILTLH